MEVMAMAKMTMPKMAVAMPVMAVMAVTAMPAVATMPAVAAMAAVAMTAGESLARDGERGSGQRQNRDSGRNRLLDPGHARLLVEQREDRPAMIQPRRAGCEAM
jgi:hypothetical protein